MLNRDLLKQKLNRQAQGKQDLFLKELHLNNESQLDQLSDEQLEQRLTPKVLGFLSLKKEDLYTW